MRNKTHRLSLSRLFDSMFNFITHKYFKPKITVPRKTIQIFLLIDLFLFFNFALSDVKPSFGLNPSNESLFAKFNTMDENQLQYSYPLVRYNCIIRNNNLRCDDNYITLTYLNLTDYQNPLLTNKSVQKDRLLVASGIVLSANVILYNKFKNIWWNHSQTGFHFYRGWRRTEGWYDFGPHDSLWFHMDKLGHFYNTRLLSIMLSDLAYWVGYSELKNRWIGAFGSSLFYLQIELFDAQYEEWGFSLGDFFANTAGAFMPILAQKFPFMQKFTLKFSYLPSKEISNEPIFTEDYAGMTFWLSTNPSNFLPIDSIWPEFLNIALGYGITQKAYGDIELYIAFDYDLQQIKTRHRFFQRVLYYLNFIHFPAPTIRLTPKFAFHLFYY